MDGKRSCEGLWAAALGERRDTQTLWGVLSGCVKGDRQKRQRKTYGEQVRRQAGQMGVTERGTERGASGVIDGVDEHRERRQRHR